MSESTVLEPMRWSAERPPSSAPLYYTAPGGWLIVHEPADHAPDRPWVLRQHGVRLGRFHTLRIAKSAPLRSDLLPEELDPEHLHVVTRYGGHRHIARRLDSRGRQLGPRFYTECRGVSSWSLVSWAANPDHPLGLSVDEMAELPECPTCRQRVTS